MTTKWLKQLNDQINKFYPSKEGSKIGLIFPTKNLTEEEWERVKQAIEEHDLPCLLQPTSCGFALLVYENKDVIIFSTNKPKILLIVQDSQFPFPSSKKGFLGQMTTLVNLAPITHGDRNKSLLRQHGFEPLREIGHYEY